MWQVHDALKQISTFCRCLSLCLLFWAGVIWTGLIILNLCRMWGGCQFVWLFLLRCDWSFCHLLWSWKPIMQKRTISTTILNIVCMSEACGCLWTPDSYARLKCWITEKINQLTLQLIIIRQTQRSANRNLTIVLWWPLDLAHIILYICSNQLLLCTPFTSSCTNSNNLLHCQKHKQWCNLWNKEISYLVISCSSVHSSVKQLFIYLLLLKYLHSVKKPQCNTFSWTMIEANHIAIKSYSDFMSYPSFGGHKFGKNVTNCLPMHCIYSYKDCHSIEATVVFCFTVFENCYCIFFNY